MVAQGALPKVSAVSSLDQTSIIDDVTRLIDNLDYVLDNTPTDTTGPTISALLSYSETLKSALDKRDVSTVPFRADQVLQAAENASAAYLLSRDLRNRIFLRARTKESKVERHESPIDMARRFALRQKKVANREVAALEMLLDKQTARSLPYLITIEPSSMCNFACVMCPQGIYSLRPGFTELTSGQIASLQEIFPSLELMHCQIVGEPTASKQLGSLTDRALADGVLVAMVTNGSLLHVTNADIPSFHHITFSFDGATAKTFEMQRAGGNFEVVVNNIREARKRAPNTFFAFNVVLSRLNLHELPDIVRLAKELGVQRVMIRTLNVGQRPLLLKTPQHSHLDLMALGPEHANEVGARIAESIELGNQIGVDVQNMIEDDSFVAEFGTESSSARDVEVEIKEIERKRPQGAITAIAEKLLGIDLAADPVVLHALLQAPEEEVTTRPTEAGHEKLPDPIEARAAYVDELNSDRPKRFKIAYCGIPWNSAIVHASGNVVPCCYLGNLVLGRVGDEGFGAVWNNQKYNDFRSAMINGEGLPPACLKCNGADRFVHVVDMLKLAAKLGYSWQEIEWPENFAPPTQVAAHIERLRNDLFDDREPVYRLGEEMKAASDQARKHLKYGFAPIAQNARWTDGYESHFVFRCNVPEASNLEFEISAYPFVDAQHRPEQRVEVVVDNVKRDELSFNSPRFTKAKANLGLCKPDERGQIRVKLMMPDATTRKDVGLDRGTVVRALFIDTFRLFVS